MEALYASVQLWFTVEECDIPFPYWKGVDEYRYPVGPTSLSANFTDVFPEVLSLLHSRVEHTFILNYITQDKNKVLVDNSNETVKFHKLESIMEEDVPTFQSVV